MKQSEMIVLGLAGLAVYLIWKARGGAAAVSESATLRSSADSIVSEIFDAAGRAFGNGWRYFNDGTAIDPAGNYYREGQLIWSKPTSGAGGSW